MGYSRRDFLKGASAAVISGAVTPIWPRNEFRPSFQGDGEPSASGPTSFALEHYAAHSLNYLERLVDTDGLPYFNVFWTRPPEAAHDWPDFGDVMSRQWQGSIMLRTMTGREAVTERIWRDKILALVDPSDSLLHRPATSYSKPVADWGDNSLTLYALATAAVESGDESLRQATRKMAEGMLKGLRSGQFSSNPFAIKSLMIAAREVGCEAGLEASRILVDRSIVNGRMFTPDNTFGPSGHMHGNLRSMVGAADYALATGNPVLFSRIDALYRYVKTTGTRFGFLPEAIGRRGDIIACETCALMDFAGVGVTLANHGHPEYWGDMERLARNHLVESQIRDASWLESGDAPPDSAQFTYRDIGQRILGAWAGWSSPNHILACRETLNAHWGGPELKNKVRALQNCCGGSGLHGLFILWKNSARFEAGTLSVNMHIDKKLPQAEIRCEQPWRGLLRIQVKVDCGVRIRIPEFTSAAEMRIRVNKADLQTVPPAFGNYFELKELRAEDRIEVAYPLPIWREEFFVGNPGFRRWRYRATWKGETVVRMEPVDNESETAYSDFDKANVRVYYGENGPAQLYQREQMIQEARPSDAEIQLDNGALDFWNIK